MSNAKTPRLMPNPWFQATASANIIAEIIRGEAYRAPRKDERALGPYILPPFQRHAVWTQDQQIKLLESVWDGLPIGSIVVNMCYGKKTDGWLLDGQQRVTSIIAYANGEFPVYGYKFTELDIVEQRLFRSRPIGVNVMQSASEAECKNVYDRLAYGGTPHSPEQYSK